VARRILCLLAHPAPERSEVIVPLSSDAAGHGAVTLVDLYAQYPDFCIDIDREQQRLQEHDVLMFMYPLHWYSTPALLKEWQDLVLEYGFAYGSEGVALRGKHFLCVCSAGGPEEAYSPAGYNHRGLREFLLPLEQTARLCGMQVLPPLPLFGARTAVREGRLPAHREDFRGVLDALAGADLQPWADSDAQTLQELLSEPEPAS
jgi:glutathione-regulated potassium-efflux system ancillary protein KefG